MPFNARQDTNAAQRAARQHRFPLPALFVGVCCYTLGVVGWLVAHRVVEVQAEPSLQRVLALINAVEATSSTHLSQAPDVIIKTPPQRAYVPISPVKPLPERLLPPRLVPLTAPLATATPPPLPPPSAPKTTEPEASAPTLMSVVQSLPEEDQSATDYRLVGLLELGDRSIALFDIDNVTQQIAVGETIGSSGWKLATITQRSAEIHRQNEKRLVYVGQSF